MLSNKGAQAGFSLIELMVAITIMVVLMTLAVPGFRALVQNARIRNAAESIQNGLQFARAEAVRRNGSVQFNLRGTHSAWTVCAVPAAPGSCPDPDDGTTIQSRAAGEGASTAINVTPTPGGTSSIIFNNLGAVTVNADTFTQVDLDIDPAVLPAAQSRELRVTIGPGGSIRMCDPARPSPDPRAC